MKRTYGRLIGGVLASTLALASGLAGCGDAQKADPTAAASAASTAVPAGGSTVPAAKTPQPAGPKPVLRVGALKGPTGMGMAKLMEDDAQGKTAVDYEFTLLDSPDDMTAKIINGDLDAAAVPTNMALTLYNKTGGAVQLAAVNTLGVLSLLENGSSIKSVADLKGKTIYTSGKGATQDFAFRYILKQNGLDPEKDVTLDYKLQQAELAAAAASGDAALALLPQPHVTTAMMKNPNLRVALDITQEWAKASGSNDKLAMGCVLVQKKYAQANKGAFTTYLEEYKQSVQFVNGQADQAAELIAKHAILPNAAVAKKAIPLSNIVYIDAQEAKPFLNKFYQVLFDFEPKSVGGKLADDAFYYAK
ncbi:ABC transporter substrate-binding protein [Gorillibacterium sp. sgz5001074]|uniref:ABC transporter substrate-binding protein n=1 Tax=Gorillibacterium sp. sgz5001074 TaxID=3446695 RepID=UPI003F667421